MTLAVLPIAIPLVTAVLGMLLWRSPQAQRGIAVLGAFALLAAALGLLATVTSSGAQIVYVGGWSPPFAISLVADALSALMVLVTAVVALCGVFYSLGEVTRSRVAAGYFPLLQLLIAAVCGAFLTGDMFNLFVWFEVMLITSFVLMAMGGERLQMTGAIKYVALNLLSSALFLVAVGILYAVCHSLSMADLPARLAVVAQTHPDLVVVMAALFAVSFAIKAGLFPLFSWLPASYHTPPAAVSAVFAGLLTKVGVYALLRVFGAVFPALEGLGPLVSALLVVAGATMLAGVLGAVAQTGVRRILGFHIISQIGYILVGVGIGIGVLGSGSPEIRTFAVAAAVFYTVHHILVKSNLFFIAGIIERLGGSGELVRLGGLARRAPWLALLFLIPALSLAGIPPLSGFWAKLAVLSAAFQAEHYALAAAAVAAGVLTLISMMKIWNGAFWKPEPDLSRADESPTIDPRLAVASLPPVRPRVRWVRIAPVVALAVLTVAIGLAPQVLFDWSQAAADALLASGPVTADPAGELVLGAAPDADLAEPGIAPAGEIDAAIGETP